MTVARGVQEVKVEKGWNRWVWVWQAFLQNGSGAVFCNHRHVTANGALTCSGKMARAGGHPILAADGNRKRSSA